MTADDIKVGHYYEGKHPQWNYDGVRDDRRVLCLLFRTDGLALNTWHPFRWTHVQYDSPISPLTTAFTDDAKILVTEPPTIGAVTGHYYPTVTMEEFLAWVGRDVTSPS